MNTLLFDTAFPVREEWKPLKECLISLLQELSRNSQNDIVKSNDLHTRLPQQHQRPDKKKPSEKVKHPKRKSHYPSCQSCQNGRRRCVHRDDGLSCDRCIQGGKECIYIFKPKTIRRPSVLPYERFGSLSL